MALRKNVEPERLLWPETIFAWWLACICYRYWGPTIDEGDTEMQVARLIEVVTEEVVGNAEYHQRTKGTKARIINTAIAVKVLDVNRDLAIVGIKRLRVPDVAW